MAERTANVRDTSIRGDLAEESPDGLSSDEFFRDEVDPDPVTITCAVVSATVAVIGAYRRWRETVKAERDANDKTFSGHRDNLIAFDAQVGVVDADLRRIIELVSACRDLIVDATGIEVLNGLRLDAGQGVFVRRRDQKAYRAQVRLLHDALRDVHDDLAELDEIVDRVAAVLDPEERRRRAAEAVSTTESIRKALDLLGDPSITVGTALEEGIALISEWRSYLGQIRGEAQDLSQAA